MKSTQGVRQGDPLASLLFACAFHTALKNIAQNLVRPTCLIAYHDDTTIVGQSDDLLDALPMIEHEFNEIGLKVQRDKSRLVDFNWSGQDVELKQQWEELDIPVDDKCAMFLGCPVGATPADEEEYMQSKLAQQLLVLEPMADSNVSLHHAATILRVSTVHKLDHWLRNVDPNTMQQLAHQFDHKIKQFFYEKLEMFQQISLIDRRQGTQQLEHLIASPVSLGGDGISTVASTVHMCWIAGVASALAVPTTFNLFANFADGQPRQTSNIHNSLDAALEVLHNQCKLPTNIVHMAQQPIGQDKAVRLHRINASPVGASRSAAGSDQSALLSCNLPRKAEQLFKLMAGANHRPGSKAASQLLANIRKRYMLARKLARRVREEQANNMDRARLLAIRAKGANRVMLMGGRTAGIKVTDLTYRNHFALRHGIPADIAVHNYCFGCGKDVTNAPNHELGCVLGFGDDVKLRHDLICDTIAKCLKAIGGITKREPTPFTDEDVAKRPDVEWLIDGRRIFFDVSIIHPLNPTIRDKAATKQLAAALDREKSKNRKYQQISQNVGAEFVPLVIESFGGYGKQFKTFLSDLHLIAQQNLTLIDGESIINDMLNQIAFHIAHLNEMIMEAASSRQTR